MMKKFFAYIAMALLCLACSNNDIADEDRYVVCPEEESTDILLPENISCAVMPVIGIDPEVDKSRSTLYYDYISGGTTFQWIIDEENTANSDKIGVFPKTSPETNSVVMPFKLDEYYNGDPTIGTFGKLQGEDGYQTFVNNTYMAYYPYTGTESFNYTNIPVDYENQKQTGIPKIYYNRYKDSSPNGMTTQQCIDRYVESEQAACTHLSQKDYLVGKTTPSIASALHFKMKRMSAIIRFYIVVPVKDVYDKLQVFNPNEEKPFVVQTTMNAEELKLADTPVKTSRSIFLQLGDTGFNLTDSNPNIQDYKYSDKYPVVMTAYMMAAPIDLSGTDDKQCVLYLHSNSDHPNNHRVYKATLAKKNIKGDYLNQWTVTNVEQDEPITFSAIEIQQWKDETSINNTEGGNGTQTW